MHPGQGIPEQQPGHQQENDEQGVGSSPPDREMEQRLNQRMQNGEERQPSYQQGDDGQSDVLSQPLSFGGQPSDVSYPIPEMEEIAGHGLNVRERHPVYQQGNGRGSNDLNHSLVNGGEEVPREESTIQESFPCQFVNGQQQQPRYQESTQANALSYPTQEMGQASLQWRDRQEVRHPIQETGRFAEWQPDEHDDLPPCNQQLDDADINGVSSTGVREQAVEHNCSSQELQLWNQKLNRQADVSYCMLHLYGK